MPEVKKQPSKSFGHYSVAEQEPGSIFPQQVDVATLPPKQTTPPDRSLALVSVGFANFILWSSSSFVFRVASSLPLAAHTQAASPSPAAWILNWPMLIYAPSLLGLAMIPACFCKTGRHSLGLMVPFALLAQVLLLTIWFVGAGDTLLPHRPPPAGP